jgi:hypothetical protein
MHRAFLPALAAATLVMMMPAGSSSVGHASTSLVREAAIVCGGNGCNPVHTKSEQRRKFKTLEYTKPVRQSAISPVGELG